VQKGYLCAKFEFSDNNFGYFPTKKEEITKRTKLNDGSLVYDSDYRNSTIEEINQKAKKYINGSLYSLNEFTEIDTVFINKFKKLINFIKEEKFLL